ncbi:MAG: molybdopterin-dependent oxidoreductase [Deltaproteobacteria bacterium]|nr:molybdopterin-dependent oxidoreductase [Deltaproteobacteria bacterium]
MSHKLGPDGLVIPTGCVHDCGGKCLLKAHVRNGQVMAITSDDGEEPQLRACLRGRAYRQRLYAPDRLLYPLKRAGDRGEGKFERITWDEALTQVASELTRIKNTYGCEAILHCGGPGSLSLLHRPSAWLSYFLGKFGGYTARRGSMSFQGALDATRYTYGCSQAGNEIEDVLNSRFIILWSWNSAETINGTNTTWVLTQAREKGIPIVIVDPRYTDTAVLAEEWIPIYPGTDAAMMVAMAYVMSREGLHDRAFLEQYTVGFDRFLAYLQGEEDGIPKTPLWAEAITGVPAATIERLARSYATSKPAALLPGWGMQRTAYGEQSFRASITLAVMTGNVGIPGGNPAGHWAASLPFGRLPEARNPVGKSIPTCEWAEAILTGPAGGYPNIQMLYLCGSNLLMQRPNVPKGIQALRKLEFIVCHDQFLTPTAHFADILLPVTMDMEQNDLTGNWGMGHSAVFSHKVVEPAGECRSDLEIFADLARRLGIRDYETRTEREWLDHLLSGSEIPDSREFQRRGVHHFPRPKPDVAFEKEISDPAHYPFGTPSGKIEIYSQQLADLGRPNVVPPIPKYIEPWEGRHDPLRKQYPLQLLTPHGKRTALSVYANIPWIQEVEPQAMWIHPLDAEARGIHEGDRVRVFNDRGAVMIRAKVTQRIMPGVVSIDHGLWVQPDQKGVDWDGLVNNLTRDQGTPIGDGATTHSCLVEVEKTEGRSDAASLLL